MDKLNALLDKLYANQESMIYFYGILGGIALLLIILIIITSFKIKKAKKNEASVNEIKEADVGISTIEPVMSTITSEPVKDEISKEAISEPVVQESETVPDASQNKPVAEENLNNEPSISEVVSTPSNDDYVSDESVNDVKLANESHLEEEFIKEPINAQQTNENVISSAEEEVPEIEMPKPAKIKEPILEESPVIKENKIDDRAKTISELLNSNEEPNVIKDATDEFGTKPATNDLSDLKARLDSMRRK